MSHPGGEAAGDTLSGSHLRQTLLQEVFAHDYDVTEEEVVEYCEKLGINSEEEPHLVPLARAALLHPLPSHWTPVKDPQLGLYFFNRRTGESRWNHPIDAIVYSLIAGEKSNVPCADSLTEELDAEELQISEFLKAQVSDEKHVHSDGNIPSEHTTTDAFTLTSQCLKASEKPLVRPPPHTDRPASVTSNLDAVERELGENSRSDSDDGEGSAGSESRGKESGPRVPSEGGEGNVHTDSKTQEDISVSVKELDPEKERHVDSVHETRGKECEVGDVTRGDANSNVEDSRQRTEQIEGHGLCVSCPQRSSTTSSRSRDLAMFTGRDGLGRGLGRVPLGTPSSLAAPPPLGSSPLGSSPLGAARVPPIGGQLTPLAPIAAASRGGPPQLAPMKPVWSSSQQPPASKEGQGPPSPRRLTTQEQNGRGGWPEKHLGGRGGEAREQGDGTDRGLTSPPKSILKGPVLARGTAGRGQSQGLDRMQLLHPKETKNIRFDFRTDDLEFHTSEEEYDEDLEEEEGGEDEEEEYEEEEEFDSEAEDPEEEAMFRGRGVLDEKNAGSGLMLQDASDLMASRPASLPLKRQPALPHGPDPWATEYPEKPKPQERMHDPLKDFRKEKEIVEKGAKKQSETKTLQSPLKQPQQTKPFESSHSNTQPSKNNNTGKLSGENLIVQSQQNKPNSAISSRSKTQQHTPVTQNTLLSGVKSQDVKAPEPKLQEDRKLELEGAPKNRKVNPLDRVVAKLSGKTEERSNGEEPKPGGTVKNVTVNLAELMAKEEESEDDDSSGNDDGCHPEVKISQQDLKQESQVLAKQLEAEVGELRRRHETQLKALKEQLNKEYHDLEEKLRQEHNFALNKLKDQEKKKFESSQNQILQKAEEESQKSLTEAKARLEENLAERKRKLLEDLKKKNEEELEQLKIGFVRDMQQRKEELLQEHEEEMQELEEDLKELYSQQKTDKQEELDAAQTAVARSSSDSAAAAAALSELELSMAEVLRQRQTQIKREHNRQLATLEEKLDEELEKAARQAKERETVEKRNHSAHLTALKDDQERELGELEESHARHLQDLEAEHEADVNKLKSEFRAELMRQKTELENKLTEFRIEYEQKMDSLGQEEQPEEGGEASEERSVEINNERRQDGKQIYRDVKKIQEDDIATSEGTTGGKERIQDEEKKYDEILKELQERRKSLEDDLEELKAQENKVKELKTQHLTSSHSHCHKNTCIHETKYNRMKAKYSSLVSRIKSQKAKRSSRPSPATQNTPSLSSDKSSLESNANAWDSGQASTDPTLSTTSPSPHHPTLHKSRHQCSTSEASEDEEVRFATEVLEKYNKVSDHSYTRELQNGHMKHRVTTPLSSTPRKAWAEDELLAHGRKELSRAEKFLRSRHIKNHQGMQDVTAEDMHREILRQNAGYSILNTKTGLGCTPLAHGGSVTSDTESDEPTHDVPSPASDFGLDRMLDQIGSANKRSQTRLQHHSSRRRHGAPCPTGSLELGLNNPLNTYSSGPLRLEHLTSGSVPDLGPETVDRIANVNRYLQQRWTSYFGELSVPLGGKVGWPAQVIGQSTLLANKGTVPSDANVTEKQEKSSFFMGDGGRHKSQENIKNVSERIDDLRAWLQKAQATSASFYDK